MQPITKAARYLMIISVVLSAIFGIFALFSQNQGWYQLQILLTALTISGASLCILACTGLMERKTVRLFPTIGILLAVIGAILMIGGIWQNSLWSGPFYFKITFSVIIYAIATAHICLLSMEQLSQKYESILWLAYFAIYSLASIISLMLFSERPTAATITWQWQILGMTAIVVGSVSVLVPILQKFSMATKNADQSSKIAAVICPECGDETIHALGDITCKKCHSLFVVKVLWVGKP